MKPTARQHVDCSFIVPIRRVKLDPFEVRQLAEYFKLLRLAGCEVLIVDGSPRPVFEAHKRYWQGFSRHVAPDPKYTYLNGKVNGVHTGVDLASCERIILADDDIRYGAGFIAPLPWWARLETARILINRGVLRAGDIRELAVFVAQLCAALAITMETCCLTMKRLCATSLSAARTLIMRSISLFGSCRQRFQSGWSNDLVRLMKIS